VQLKPCELSLNSHDLLLHMVAFRKIAWASDRAARRILHGQLAVRKRAFAAQNGSEAWPNVLSSRDGGGR
jgi:hypothetical protein